MKSTAGALALSKTKHTGLHDMWFLLNTSRADLQVIVEAVEKFSGYIITLFIIFSKSQKNNWKSDLSRKNIRPGRYNTTCTLISWSFQYQIPTKLSATPTCVTTLSRRPGASPRNLRQRSQKMNCFCAPNLSPRFKPICHNTPSLRVWQIVVTCDLWDWLGDWW